jgi:non-specific serine/threonine protein kinase/serine/threonine-protein kinase
MIVTRVSWQHVKEILSEALLLAPEQRSRFLDEACSSNNSLRAEVESLLAASEDVRDTFLQSRQQFDPSSQLEISGAVSLAPGQIFAERFLLFHKLGEGGMGQVWLADQLFPVRRQVALKLIKAGMYDESVVQRFQSERQALAIMDHPAIAKVFDAGTTPQGQPYFVMEYVPGLPITEYCDQKKLTIQRRLELFIQACEGVQHAHLKAIIHRDLKPANILVTEVDGKPVPRIIDFGLAKATTPTVDGENPFTRFGDFMGTPGYISPEQADPGLQDIDTRTDVYSLGVVLYVLLTGSQPIDMKQWMREPLHESLRRLREVEPPAPSARVHSDRQTAASIAEARGTEPRHLTRLLRGDLDWIAMKALEKDRARRYAAPSELAADLRRYLNHEPVLARPASRSYQAKKYVQRHRVGVAVAAGLVLLLAAFSVLQALQLRQIKRERDRATRERDRATRISGFMTDMFRVSDPNNARGNNVTAREVLDKASKDLGTGLARDPEVQAQMMQVMSNTYSNLGLYSPAHELAQSALDANLRLHGPNDAETLESMARLGAILLREGHFAEAEKLERQAIAGERRDPGADQEHLVEAMAYLGFILAKEGLYGDAEKQLREALDIGARRLGPENRYVDMTHSILGIALVDQARYAEAEQEFANVVEYSRRNWGPDDPRTLTSTASLALTYQHLDRLAQAESLYREVLAAQQRVYGPGNVATAYTMENLAALLVRESRPADAEKLSREALAIRMRIHGPDHPDTFVSRLNLGIELFYEGKIREAERVQREALAAKVCVSTPEGRNCPVGRTYFARTLTKEGHYAEAEKVARQGYEALLRFSGPKHPDTKESELALARVLAFTHRYAEASKMFRDTIDSLNNPAGQEDLGGEWYDFACVAAAAGRPGDAFQFLNQAIRHGYKDVDNLSTDEDLENLHGDPRFKELVAAMKRPAA